MSNSSVILRASAICLALALLTAIIYCVLGPYSHMSRIWWIPDWVGNWADRHPYFRSFPPFAAFSALLFFVAGLFRPTTANCLLNTSAAASTSHQPLATRYFQWRRLCFGAVALLGTGLEFMQQLVPERSLYPHPRQIMWSVLGAFFGAFAAAFASVILPQIGALTTAN